MKAVFSLVAGISALIGVITLFLGLVTWNIVAFISGVVALVYSYAWSLVGSMWERLEEFERKLSRIE